ncbi:MAG: glycosyltransferase [Chloroflexi bacterium]|nr:MAG: glycosyltransferase [Chloroflexota bacterium]MBL1193689.1 glycosyltransferase [Chloroflexota bacterium]NOH10981.1 glycosyltransferase [Chloroflexota bacterium]
MRILIISDRIPYPVISGDRIRVFNLLKRIAPHHEVSMAVLLSAEGDEEGAQFVRENYCENVITARHNPMSKLRHVPGFIRYAAMGRPLEVKFYDSPDLHTQIRGLLSREHFDIVQIEHAHMAFYVHDIPKDAQTKKILVFHNVASVQTDRMKDIEGGPVDRFRGWLNSQMMPRWETRIANRFDRSVSMSDEDRQLLLEANPKLDVDVVPNGVDTSQYTPLSNTRKGTPSVMFIGNMSYSPNEDAALYFAEEILPLIWEHSPEVEFWIVGRDVSDRVKAIANERIHVTGRVDAIEPYYERAWLSVVPLRAGGGTRLKILEAMALGRPVVSTTVGAEGLAVEDGADILLADTPETFSQQVLRLLSDESLYKAVMKQGRKLVEEKYDWDPIAEKQLEVYEALGTEAPA